MKVFIQRCMTFIVLSLILTSFLPQYTFAQDNPYANVVPGGTQVDVPGEAGAGTPTPEPTGTVGETGEVTTVWADSGNAIQDIMYLTEDGADRFAGAISTISGITRFVDTWFIRIVSIVAFFIISAALLKNALAGAYVANTKFWDKVDMAHKTAEQVSLQSVGQYFTGGGFKSTSMGGVKNAILAIIPNIKAFTDFETADIEPKAYFMKAIPQMIACVVIGVFIYNGFYRDTAATVGSMGSVLLTRTFASISPESFVNKIFNTTSWPEFGQKGDTTLEGRSQLKVCEALKSSIISEFSDIGGTENKVDIVSNTSASVAESFANIQEWFDLQDVGYHYEISNIRVIAVSKEYIEAMSEKAMQKDFRPRIENVSEQSDIPVHGYFNYYDDLGVSRNKSSDVDKTNTFAYVAFTLKAKQGSVLDGASAGSGLGRTSNGGAKREAAITVAYPGKDEPVVINVPQGATITKVSIESFDKEAKTTDGKGLTLKLPAESYQDNEKIGVVEYTTVEDGTEKLHRADLKLNVSGSRVGGE